MGMLMQILIPGHSGTSPTMHVAITAPDMLRHVDEGCISITGAAPFILAICQENGKLSLHLPA